jgi:hypothetical protein
VIRLLRPVRERRSKPRLPFEGTVQVYPVQADRQLGKPIEGWGRDLSSNGMGLLLPREVGVSPVYLHAPLPSQPAPVALLGQLVRIRPACHGLYEAGAILFTAGSRGVEK